MNEAARFFSRKLQFETDPADVWEMLQEKQRIVVVDTRRPEGYEQAHVPGAINFPHRTMTAQSTAALSKDVLYVTYCDGIGCNASTRGALKLSELGFRVKEMLGGIDWWLRDGLPVARGTEDSDALRQSMVRCAC